MLIILKYEFMKLYPNIRQQTTLLLLAFLMLSVQGFAQTPFWSEDFADSVRFVTQWKTEAQTLDLKNGNGVKMPKGF